MSIEDDILREQHQRERLVWHAVLKAYNGAYMKAAKRIQNTCFEKWLRPSRASPFSGPSPVVGRG